MDDEELAKRLRGLAVARGVEGCVSLIGRWVVGDVGSADVGDGDDVQV